MQESTDPEQETQGILHLSHFILTILGSVISEGHSSKQFPSNKNFPAGHETQIESVESHL